MTSDEAASRPSGVRWVIFGLGCAISWLLYLHRYAWSVIRTDFKKDNPDISERQMGWLDSAFMATYAIGQVPLGMAGDLFGVRLLMVALVLLWSLSVGLMAWLHGFWLIYGLRLAFGFFQAGAYPLVSKVTRTWFPLAYRTTVQGVVTALGRIGGACAPIIVATLLMGWGGMNWQDALVTISAFGAVMALAFWWSFRDKPAEHPLVNEAERQLIGTSQQSGADQRVPLRLTSTNSFSFAMLLLYAFASSFADMLYVNLIPSFLEEAKGLDKATMGWFAPLPLLGGAIGGILGGMLNDRLIRATGNRRWARSSVAFTGKCLAGVLIAVSITIDDGRWVMVVLLVSKFFGDWSLPTQWGTVTDISGRAAATVFAVVNTVGAVAAFAAGPAMALTKEWYGWDGLFLGVAGVYLVAAACWISIDCTRRLDA